MIDECGVDVFAYLVFYVSATWLITPYITLLNLPRFSIWLKMLQTTLLPTCLLWFHR